MITRSVARALDRRDPFRKTRACFVLPKNTIYLDGNSLGALPRAVETRLRRLTKREWAKDLISSWNTHQWIDLPATVGDKIATLIGARAGEVVAADSTSVCLHKALHAAVSLNPKRRVVVTEDKNFPSDLYVLDALARDRHLKIVRVKADQVERAIDTKVAVLALTHANYRTSEVFDMKRLNHAARKAGVLTVWDLSHSAGAMPIDLNGTKTDFAVGCGYKYLNGGPGAPGYLFIAKRHQRKIAPALPGWMGHAHPFAFAKRFVPAPGMQRHLTGTPYVYGLTTLSAALDVYRGVSLKALYAKAGLQGDLFLFFALSEGASLGLRPACPINRASRGSQVTLRHPHAYAVMQALIAAGVVGDFRPPDILRFGFSPLYTSYQDVVRAAQLLVKILKNKTYRQHRYTKPKRVT